MTEVKVVNDTRTLLGEGPIWHQGVLYWIDIEAKQVFITHPSGAQRTIQLKERVGTVVPQESGGLILALESGFAHLDTVTEKLTPICDPESDILSNRFNDGKCDARGRLWAGTMNTNFLEEKYTGTLYMLDTKGVAHPRLSEIGISNGICWSLDEKTMYYVDTFRRSIDAFDFNSDDGAISRRRTIVSFPGHLCPDGMTIDSEGNLWTAVWGDSCVACHNPNTGELLQKVEVPAEQVSACAFGGDDLGTLYITTASIHLSKDQLKSKPLSGALFAARPGVKGIPSFTYKGDGVALAKGSA